MDVWRFSNSFFVGGSEPGLKHSRGRFIKVLWPDRQVSASVRTQSSTLSSNEHMPCVRAGFFLLLLLLLLFFYTSSRFIRLPLPGSDYPQSLNPTRKLPASPESASLQFIAPLPHTHTHTHSGVMGGGAATLHVLRGSAVRWLWCFSGYQQEKCVCVCVCVCVCLRDHCEPDHVLWQPGWTLTQS